MGENKKEMMQKITRFIIYISLACLVPILGHAQVEVDTETEATEADVDRIAINIQIAVSLALDNNFSIRKQEREVLASKRTYSSRWNDFVPDVNLALALNRNFNANGSSPAITTPPDWTLNPTLSVSLNLAVDTIARWQIIRLQYETQNISAQVVEANVTRDVRKIFYDVLLQKTAIEIAKSQLEVSEELFDLSESAYQSGLTPEYNVLLAELQVEQDKVSIIRLESVYGQLLDNLKLLLGLQPEVEIEIEGGLDVDAVAIKQVVDKEASNILSRPDIQLLHTQLNLLKKQKSLQEQLLSPRLSIAYTVQPNFGGDIWNDNLFDGDLWSSTEGMLSFNLTFSVGNVLPYSDVFTQRYSAIQQVEKQKLAIDEAIEHATIAHSNLRNSILSGLELIRTIEINIYIAEHAYSLVRNAYESGVQTYDQLREAEQKTRQVRLSLLQEQRDVLKNLAEWVYIVNVPETSDVLF